MEENIIDKFCEQEGFKIAQRIEEKMAIVIKPKPWYCPTWLYKRIIRDSVGIVQS